MWRRWSLAAAGMWRSMRIRSFTTTGLNNDLRQDVLQMLRLKSAPSTTMQWGQAELQQPNQAENRRLPEIVRLRFVFFLTDVVNSCIRVHLYQAVHSCNTNQIYLLPIYYSSNHEMQNPSYLAYLFRFVVIVYQWILLLLLAIQYHHFPQIPQKFRLYSYRSRKKSIRQVLALGCWKAQVCCTIQYHQRLVDVMQQLTVHERIKNTVSLHSFEAAAVWRIYACMCCPPSEDYGAEIGYNSRCHLCILGAENTAANITCKYPAWFLVGVRSAGFLSNLWSTLIARISEFACLIWLIEAAFFWAKQNFMLSN